MDHLSIMLSALGAFLLCSSFIKLALSLNIARYGLGLGGGVMGFIVSLFSFALALLIAGPELQPLKFTEKILSADATLSGKDVMRALAPSMEKRTDSKIKERLLSKVSPVSKEAPGSADIQTDTPQIAPFLITEIRDALQIGLVVLIPFLIVDLIVVHLLMLLGITNLSVFVVSLPLKLLLFVVVDGWALLSEKLLNGYFS